MRRFLRKKTGIPDAAWWGITFFLGLVLILQVQGVWERYTVEREMLNRRVEAEATLDDLQQQKTDLQAQVQYMTDTRGVEEELRQNFDVALPGERVFILTGERPSEVEQSTTSISETEDRPWYWFW